MNEKTPDPTEPVQPSSDKPNIARPHRSEGHSHRPTHVGPCEILETLGEGGMSVVYLARQTKPIHRRGSTRITLGGRCPGQCVRQIVDGQRDSTVIPAVKPPAFAEAESLYVEALAMYKRLAGEEHLDVVRSALGEQQR